MHSVPTISRVSSSKIRMSDLYHQIKPISSVSLSPMTGINLKQKHRQANLPRIKFPLGLPWGSIDPQALWLLSCYWFLVNLYLYQHYCFRVVLSPKSHTLLILPITQSKSHKSMNCCTSTSNTSELLYEDKFETHEMQKRTFESTSLTS